jgi:phosphohistidine swiveling domain-containing protein
VLESSGGWSGAFTSIPEIQRHEIVRAVKSVWATNFSIEVLDRLKAAEISPEAALMGVLIQPEIVPDFGGAARIDGRGAVTVTAVKGTPRDLMAGWAPGVKATFENGQLVGTEAIELVGEMRLRSIVDLAVAVAEKLDHNLIEWAIHDGKPVLLQIQRSRTDEVGGAMVVPAALGHPFAREFIELAHQYPGALGEELVLSWLPGMRRSVQPVWPTHAVQHDALMAEARELAAELTSVAWGLPADQAQAKASLVLRRMRSDRPNESIDALNDLQPVDVLEAARLLGMVDCLRQTQRGSTRHGMDRWEPVLAGVVALQGEEQTCVPSVGGIGAGRLVWVESSKQTEHVRERDIIVMQYPLPNFSPLLWDAAGVITLGGAPTAHLFEVARSLTVPAVADCPIGELVKAGPCLGMVDGDAGRVAILRDEREPS